MDNIFQSRKTIRKYINKPVDKETLVKILEDATEAPSWANSQPWELYVAAGEPLEQLRAAYLESFEKGDPGNLDIPAPKAWPDYIQDRMSKSAEKMFHAMGIAREDQEARKENWRNNFKFFDAPVAVFLCMDASLTEWSILDLGHFSASLMLAAKAHGLDSTPAASSVSYPQHIRRILDVPDNQKIVVGIMLGYADESHPYNKPDSSRVPLEEVVRFRGI